MQKYRPKEDGKSLRVIKIKELRTGLTDDSDLCSENIPIDYIVENGDVIFSWSGTLEVLLWTGGKGGLNQHLFKVTSDNYNKWFYYLWTKHYLEVFRHEAKMKATTMGHIKRSHLKEAKVVIPIKNKLLQMNDMMESLVEKMIECKIENETLIKTRDELLPKLMSGEIRV
jgi:type I restriction enzyme S subunit